MSDEMVQEKTETSVPATAENGHAEDHDGTDAVSAPVASAVTAIAAVTEEPAPAQPVAAEPTEPAAGPETPPVAVEPAMGP